MGVPAEDLAPDLVPGINTTLKDTAPSEMSTPSNKKFTPTVQSKPVSSPTLTSCLIILVSTSTLLGVNAEVTPSKLSVGDKLDPLLTGSSLTLGVPVGVSTVTSGWDRTSAVSSNKVSLVWLKYDSTFDQYAFNVPTYLEYFSFKKQN